MPKAKFDNMFNVFVGGLITMAIVVTSATVFKLEGGTEHKIAKIVGATVVLFGTILAAIDVRPVQIITTAQVISGFFLPFISILLVIVTNSKRMLGEHTNTLFQNILGGLTTIITFILGTWGLYSVFVNFF